VTCVDELRVVGRVDTDYGERLSPQLHTLKDLGRHIGREIAGRRTRMNTTLKRTLKSLLYAGAALMILVAGSANWPNH
jgi:hypothetical protein